MLLETLGTAYRPSYAMYSTFMFNNYATNKNGYIRIDTDGKLYIHCLYSSNGENVAGVVGTLVYV